MQGNNERSRSFLTNIRAYNSALAFASLGAHVDDALSQGRGVYTFKVHGTIYHSIVRMMPRENSDCIPRFAQLYFFDTENKLQTRMHHVSHVDQGILGALQSMMHATNPYVNSFKIVAQMMQHGSIPKIRMVIYKDRANGWQYLASRGAEVAKIMCGAGG